MGNLLDCWSCSTRSPSHRWALKFDPLHADESKSNLISRVHRARFDQVHLTRDQTSDQGNGNFSFGFHEYQIGGISLSNKPINDKESCFGGMAPRNSFFIRGNSIKPTASRRQYKNSPCCRNKSIQLCPII